MGWVKSNTSVLVGIIVVPVTATSASRLASTPISPLQVPSAEIDPEELSSESWYSVLRRNGKHWAYGPLGLHDVHNASKVETFCYICVQV
jgi:hypothetical protein